MENICVCYTVLPEFLPEENCWVPGYCAYCESIDLNQIDNSHDNNNEEIP